MIVKRTGIPLYYQVEAAIRKKIESGVFGLGDKIPSEMELAKEFHVSRITIRKAVENLVQDGLLQKQQGIGTLVTKHLIKDAVNSLESFTEKMARQGRKVSSTLLEVCIQYPSEVIAESLNLGPGEQVLKISRIRNVDGLPLALFTTYVPAYLGIPSDEDFSGSLFEVYAKYGIEPYYSDRSFRAIVADPTVASILQIMEGRAALQMNYLTFDRQGRAIEYAEGIYRGDWYNYEMRFYRNARRNPAGDQ
ncbi:MAG: GntR family transcriptional regulator [Sphaerochaeta sp.]|nr:GntR family transcriptional regulator [Sphaerochaeta sp.]